MDGHKKKSVYFLDTRPNGITLLTAARPDWLSNKDIYFIEVSIGRAISDSNVLFIVSDTECYYQL